MNESAILLCALTKSDPAERAAYLTHVCGADLALRDRLEQALLRATDEIPESTVVDVPADPELEFLTPSRLPHALGRLGPYEIVQVLGRGGMGIVLKGYDPGLQRFVALKVLRGGKLAEEARQRFDREARAVAAIVQDNVIGIHLLALDHEPPYFAMPFLAGPSLQDLLDRGERLPVAEIVRLGREIAAGLAAAHAAGVVHRDIKPANLLLDGPARRVKLTDFGLALAPGEVSITSAGMVAGTPLYMSPEQARGEEVDGRSDLFSLGSVLYALCTGRPPFAGLSAPIVLRSVCDDEPESLGTLNPEVPAWLVALIGRLMAKDPAQRYPDAAAVLAAFDAQRVDRTRRDLAPVDSAPAARVWPGVAVAAGVVAFLHLVVLLWPGTVAPPGRPRAEAANPADRLDHAALPRPLLDLLGAPEAVPRAVVAVLADPVRRPFVPVSAAAYRPDGGLVALGGMQGEVLLMDSATGGLVGKPVKVHAEQVRAVAYRPDGQRLATGGFDAQVRFWNPATLQLVRAMKVPGRVHGLAYARDGKRLFGLIENPALQNRAELWVWNPDTGADLQQTLVAAAPPHALALHPNGHLLAVGCFDGLVRVFDAATLAQRNELQGHTAPVLGVAFSRDGKALYSCGDDRTVRTWGLGSGFQTGLLTVPGKPLAVAPLAGERLAVSCVEGTVLVYEVPSGREVRRWTEPGDQLRFVLPGPDGTSFVVGGWGGSTNFYGSASAQAKHAFTGHDAAVLDVAFAPAGDVLATASDDRTVGLWDTATGLARARLVGHKGPVTCLAFAPAGDRLATGSGARTLRIWEPTTGHLVRTLDGLATGVTCLRYSANGLLAAGTQGGMVHLWARGGRPERTWKASGEAIRHLAWSPDGALLATVAAEGLRLWNPTLGAEAVALSDRTAATRAVAFAPDGRTLAGAGADGRVRVWRLTGTLVREYTGPQGPVESLAYRADGKLLVAHAPGEARLHWWELETGARAGSFLVPQSRGLALSPEGRYVALACGERAACLVRLAERGTEPPFER